MIRRYLFTLLGGIFTLTAVAQQPLYLIYSKSTRVVAPSGKVAFEIPRNQVVVSEANQFVLQEEEIRPIAFESGLLPVNTRDSVYLINQTGEVVKSFRRPYVRILSPQNGMMLAYELDPGNNINFVSSYLTADGEPAFGNRKFYQATEFNEGYALVQMQKSGRWFVLSKKGEVTALEPLPGDVSFARSFHHGVAKLTVKAGSDSPLTTYFIDTTGTVVIDIQAHIDGRKASSISDCTGGYITVLYGRKSDSSASLLILNAAGEVTGQIDTVSDVTPFVEGYAFCTRLLQTPAGLRFSGSWINPKGERVELFSAQELASLRLEADWSRRINDHALLFYTVPDAVSTFNRVSVVISPAEKKVLYRSPAKVIGMAGDVLLVRDTDNRFDQLVKLPGTVLWQSPPEERVFTDVQEAMKHRSRVRHFRVKGNSIPIELFQFTNLETLYLDGKVNSIPPELSKLVKLKELRIQNAEELKSFPGNISLPALEDIWISNGSQLPGLKAFIQQRTPKLKDVNFSQFAEGDAIKSSMQKIRPSVSVSVFSFDEPLELEAVDD